MRCFNMFIWKIIFLLSELNDFTNDKMIIQHKAYAFGFRVNVKENGFSKIYETKIRCIIFAHRLSGKFGKNCEVHDKANSI